MNRFIHIRSDKFPILPGEENELVNPGTYGKALAQYLQRKLTEKEYDAPFVCCEDWGWWVELKGVPFAFGVCIYSRSAGNGTVDYVCTDGAAGPRRWSWKRMRFIATRPWAQKLHEDLMAVFQADEQVALLGVTEDFPW